MQLENGCYDFLNWWPWNGPWGFFHKERFYTCWRCLYPQFTWFELLTEMDIKICGDWGKIPKAVIFTPHMTWSKSARSWIFKPGWSDDYLNFSLFPMIFWWKSGGGRSWHKRICFGLKFASKKTTVEIMNTTVVKTKAWKAIMIHWMWFSSTLSRLQCGQWYRKATLKISLIEKVAKGRKLDEKEEEMNELDEKYSPEIVQKVRWPRPKESLVAMEEWTLWWNWRLLTAWVNGLPLDQDGAAYDRCTWSCISPSEWMVCDEPFIQLYLM